MPPASTDDKLFNSKFRRMYNRTGLLMAGTIVRFKINEFKVNMRVWIEIRMYRIKFL